MTPLSLKTFVTGASLLTAASGFAATYSQNFDAFANNISNLGDGTIIASNDGLASVQGQQLRLASDSISSQTSVFKIPGLANASLGWTATFNVTVSDTPGENPPADGFSFSWGGIAFDGSLPGVIGPNGTEHGWQIPGAPNHLTFEVDTWQNDNNGNGVRIGSMISDVHTHHAETVGNILADGTSVSGFVTLSWSPVNGASMTTTGFLTNAAFTNVAIPGFTGTDADIFVFSSRTGNADETVLIDNLNITTVPEASSLFLAAFAGLGLLGVRRRK